MINKTKWGFATMTALTLMFSQGAGAVTQAFAADGTTAQTSTQTTTTNTGTSTNTGSALNTTSGSTTDSTSQAKAGILPDNFFYFVKLMVEKIDLAFTSNDKEKAKLLSQYAAERIAEANALIQKGETAQAAQALQKAIDQQEQAVSLNNPTTTGTSDPTKTTTGDATTTPATSGTATSTPATSDQSSATNQGSPVGTTVGGTSGTDQTSGTTTVSDPTTTTGQTSTSTGSALPTNTQDLKTVNPKVANNITALLNALQHIKNPKAQASLMKNIQKSFAKLGLKLDKQPLDEVKPLTPDGEKDSKDLAENNDQTQASPTTQDDQNDASSKVESDQNQPKQEVDAVKKEVKKTTTEVKQPKSTATQTAKHEVAKAKVKAHKVVTKGYEKAKKVKSHVEKKVNEHQVPQHGKASASEKGHGSNHNEEISVQVGNHSSKH
jgi:hypothetical protein